MSPAVLETVITLPFKSSCQQDKAAEALQAYLYPDGSIISGRNELVNIKIGQKKVVVEVLRIYDENALENICSNKLFDNPTVSGAK